MNEKTLASVIKEAREKFGVSQRELSRKTKIDNNTIAKIENGTRKKPNVLSLRKLALCLNLELKELLELSGYSESDIEVTLNEYGNDFYINDDGNRIRFNNSVMIMPDDMIQNEKCTIYFYEILKEILGGYDLNNSKKYSKLSSKDKKVVKKMYNDKVKSFDISINMRNKYLPGLIESLSTKKKND